MFHLWLEWGVLFGLLPLLIFRGWIPIHFAITLLAAVALAASWRAASDGAGASELGWTPFDPDATANCLTLGLAAWAALQLAAAAWRIRHREPVFPFATQQTRVFVAVARVYAVSVAAQEFVFRGYFFGDMPV